MKKNWTDFVDGPCNNPSVKVGPISLGDYPMDSDSPLFFFFGRQLRLKSEFYIFV